MHSFFVLRINSGNSQSGTKGHCDYLKIIVGRREAHIYVWCVDLVEGRGVHFSFRNTNNCDRRSEGHASEHTGLLRHCATMFRTRTRTDSISSYVIGTLCGVQIALNW